MKCIYFTALIYAKRRISLYFISSILHAKEFGGLNLIFFFNKQVTKVLTIFYSHDFKNTTVIGMQDYFNDTFLYS